MKSETEIKKFREQILENLSGADNIEAVKFYQGIIRGLDWVVLVEEKES